MAEKSTKTKKTTSKSTSTKKSVISLNKVSFYLIASTAVLYLIALILAAVKINSIVIGALQGIATACIIIVAAILAWRYVSKKQAVWKVLYVVCLLVVIVGIIIPLVL